MKIAVAGTGYVGLSLATLLSVNNEFYCLLAILPSYLLRYKPYRLVE